MRRGKFIVFYGVNSLGKTTQAKMLVDRIIKDGKKAEYVKYAHYELEPSGPIINSYLRQGNPYNLTPTEFQIIQVLNRTQYQTTLEENLKKGITIVAEDYIGTGIAWGIGAGARPELLTLLNSHLIKEDIAFLFTGEPFSAGKEREHLHEENETLTKRVASVHSDLARTYGWTLINANRPRPEINEEIWQKVKKIL